MPKKRSVRRDGLDDFMRRKLGLPEDPELEQYYDVLRSASIVKYGGKIIATYPDKKEVGDQKPSRRELAILVTKAKVAVRGEEG